METTVLYIFIWIILGAVVGIALKMLFDAKPSDKVEMIKNWLLYAVAMAEQQLGPKTGRLKLALVYNKFVTECPSLAKNISFEYFSKLVDDVLDKFKSMLSTNEAIENVIVKKEIEE